MQYKFDALQPQFINELRAFHRKRWTSQVKFGQLNQNQEHKSVGETFPGHPDPSTPSTPQEPTPRPFNPLAINNNIHPNNQHHTSSFTNYNHGKYQRCGC